MKKEIQLVPFDALHSLGVLHKVVDDQEQLSIVRVRMRHSLPETNGIQFDVCGNSSSQPHYKLRSFQQFSDEDKMWLLRSSTYLSHIERLLRTHEALTAFQKSGFLARWFICLRKLDFTWQVLPEVYAFLESSSIAIDLSTVSKQPGLSKTRLKQLRTYVADQFGLDFINEHTDMPQWFRNTKSFLYFSSKDL